jgi:hypothetical protein
LLWSEQPFAFQVLELVAFGLRRTQNSKAAFTVAVKAKEA